MTWQEGDFHRVRIRNGSDVPAGWNTIVEIDGVQDKTITDITVHVAPQEVTLVTLTMVATVDIETPAKVESESLESRLKLIGFGARDVVPGVRWVGISVDPADAVPADLPSVVFKALAARYAPADEVPE